MYCVKCGTHLEATAAFCSECGAATGMPALPTELLPQCAENTAESHKISKKERMPMYCKFCGKPIEDAANVCPACGKLQQEPLSDAGNCELMPPPGLRRGQFYKKHFRCRAALRTAGILSYIAAALTLFVGLVQHMGIWILVDVAVLLFFGGLMHLLRSRFAAVVMSVYALICVLSVFLYGFSGWTAAGTALLVLLAAAFGLRGTFCFAHDWKQYCRYCGKVH